MKTLLALFLVMCACPLIAKPYANSESVLLRAEVEEIRDSLHALRFDISLLDEREKKQENKNSPSITALEKKVLSLEVTLNKVVSDLKTMNSSISQTLSQLEQCEARLVSQDDRLKEVGKLKNTLSSLAKGISEPLTRIYRVKEGDSLEKIARTHHTSVEALQKLNHLSQDKILIGQELKVPGE